MAPFKVNLGNKMSNSLGRKIRRKQARKAEKKAKKDLKKALNAVAGLPTSCSECKDQFDFEKHAEFWQVCAEKNSVTLLCPNCFEDNN